MAKAKVTENSDGAIHPAEPYLDWLRRTGGGSPQGVDGTSAEYDFMRPKWDRIQNVLDGTDAMRAAKTKYLPRHEYESQDGYDERLAATVLDNWTARTLETLVGKAFRDPPQMVDMPEKIEKLASDMDGAGGSFVQLAERWFGEAIAKREAWMVSDFMQGRELGRPRTLADDAEEGLRPLWRVVSPENVIFKQGSTVGGRFQWTQLRIRECSMEPDGPFGEKLVERIRVLRPGTWEIYRKVEQKRNQKPKWLLEAAGYTGLSEIPARLFSTGDKPPLEDLVHLNITHFQSWSDQRSILTTSRFAMLAASGAPPVDPEAGEKPLVVGPKQWLAMQDPQGKFYYVEHTGQAIGSGEKDLEHLEARMATYGADFLKKQPGRASATARALDSSESQSQLQMWVREFAEELHEALRQFALWMKVDLGDGKVKFKLDADVDAGDPTELQTIDGARTRRDISRKAWAAEMKARHIFHSDYDPDLDQEELENEPVPGQVVGDLSGGGARSSPAGLTNRNNPAKS